MIISNCYLYFLGSLCSKLKISKNLKNYKMHVFTIIFGHTWQQPSTRSRNPLLGIMWCQHHMFKLLLYLICRETKQIYHMINFPKYANLNVAFIPCIIIVMAQKLNNETAAIQIHNLEDKKDCIMDNNCEKLCYCNGHSGLQCIMCQ